MIDISIVVPIYNAEKYLNKCIDSLINQTKKEIEIILINDGSTDASEKIIKKYKDTRIKYFKNKNQGIGKTRNFGIEKATGKYLLFVDSDDYLELNACEELYKKAKKDKCDIVVCDFYKIYDDKKEKIKLPSFKSTTLKKSPELLLDINLAPWNKLYKTELVKENNIKFVEKLKYEDAPFVAEALDKANKISKLDKYLNYYVIHGNSETTVRDKRVFDIIKIVDMIRTYFKDKKYIKESLDKLTVRILTNYNIQQRNQKEKKVGMKFINESFDYLEKEVPNYKDNKYYQNRGFVKKTIERSKILSKLYCLLYKKKQKINIKNIITSLFYIIMTILFTYILFNILFKNNNYLIPATTATLIIGSIIYIIGIYFIYKFLNKTIKNRKKFMLITFLIFIIIQLMFAYIFAVRPSWDFGDVYNSSIEHITGTTALNTNLYFYRCSNNLPLGILLTAIFSIFYSLGITSAIGLGVIGILLNICCINIAIIFLYKIFKMYFDEDKLTIFLLLTLLYTPFITYVPIFYTDTISLPFIVMGLYFLLKLIKENNKRILNILIGGLCLGVGTNLKFTVIIVLIAFIIYYLFFLTNIKLLEKTKILIILVSTFIIPVILLNVYKAINFDTEKINQESFPITHWIMMGLTGKGGYNKEDFDYTKSFKDKTTKKEENIKIINKRFTHLINEKKILKFYTNKVLYTWGDGTYFAPAKLNLEPTNNFAIKDYVLPSENNKNYLYTTIAQVQLILTLLFIIIGMVLKKYLTSEQQQLQLFTNIIIFGVFLFFIIWETRSRYLINMIPVLLISCYLGISALLNYINSLRKVEI